jgi:hypothetical protein
LNLNDELFVTVFKFITKLFGHHNVFDAQIGWQYMIISYPNILVGWTANQKGRFSVFLPLVKNSFLT